MAVVTLILLAVLQFSTDVNCFKLNTHASSLPRKIIDPSEIIVPNGCSVDCAHLMNNWFIDGWIYSESYVKSKKCTFDASKFQLALDVEVPVDAGPQKFKFQFNKQTCSVTSELDEEVKAMDQHFVNHKKCILHYKRMIERAMPCIHTDPHVKINA